MPDVLIVDDDPVVLASLQEYLNKREVQVRIATSLKDARTELLKKIPDGVLADLVLPDGSGLELIDEATNGHTQIILMTGFPSIDTAIAGVRGSVADYLVKPIDLMRLHSWLIRLNEINKSGQSEATADARVSVKQVGIIGSSPTMQHIQELIGRVAPSDIAVLLLGKSGTGKEVAARAIHQLSRRADKPLHSMNCGAVNEHLIADELFGHERGGFTGANRLHRGYFERANGGTLFLDEITEMPIDLQAHLLRVLETRKFMRIGGDTEIDTDVRVIAATNRDPFEAIAAGKMREDLYYRLAVFPIKLPLLRERKEDIPELVNYFIKQFNDWTHTSKLITAEALLYLKMQPWPGNIRELRNAVQRAHLLADKMIGREHFELHTSQIESVANPTDAKTEAATPPGGLSINQVQRRMILTTLEEYQGNKKMAAEALGISLKTMYNKLKKYQLDG